MVPKTLETNLTKNVQSDGHIKKHKLRMLSIHDVFYGCVYKLICGVTSNANRKRLFLQQEHKQLIP